ncbi:sensor histidine kinase [Streptomyces hoynatensis]|uniref:sensor histidine kinase n=1 Tax=Streptomyces hoynatensis TaxID=1141874 RepID=UPI001F4DDAE2|nr:histidine kinase [Streptomyces hoynatensis]
MFSPSLPSSGPSSGPAPGPSPGPASARRWRADPPAAVSWCAALLFCVLLCATLAAGGPGEGAVDLPGPALVALAAALAAPLGWAGRRPWPVLAVLLAEVAGWTAAGLPAERIWPLLPGAALVTGAVAALGPPRAGRAAAALTLAVLEAAVQLSLYADGGGRRVFAPGFVALTLLLALVVLLAWLAGASVRERREHGEALRAEAAARVVADERLRIARELHDMVAHSIGVIAIQAGAGSRVLDSEPERARGTLRAIEATSRETLQGLRGMLAILRGAGPGAGDEPGAGAAQAVGFGPLAGLADLDRLVETTARTGLAVELRRLGEEGGPLPDAVDRSALRIVQEALANVVRHARAGRCVVTLERRAAELRVEVADDGRGPAAPSGAPGYGIPGMRERVALLDGEFTAGPRPGGGYLVSARLPLAAAARPAARPAKRP